MVQKRPFGDEDSYEVSSKHPRQLDYSNQIVSFLDFVRSEDMAQQPNVSVGCVVHVIDEGKGRLTDGNEKLAGDIITELPICTEIDSETSVPGCVSTSWASSSMSEQGDESKAPFHLLSPPEYCNADCPIRTLVHSEEKCTSVLQIPPQKRVPIGSDFQAILPEWGSQFAKNACDSSNGSELLTLFPPALESDLSDSNKSNYVENKLAGNCVIPMPEFEPDEYNDDKVGNGRTDCYCEGFGSLGCVRHHIKEEREKLWRTLGQERFSELGFSDMGEVVADKWSREEELLFREIVFSNPALLGKNFWDHLSKVFPTRSKKEIVSYYFNVFMLQRRAVQNRFDPMNIDSDDDDWQGSYDSGDDEAGTSEEEDEDSVVESPVCHDDFGHNDIMENDSHEPWAGGSNYENITGGFEYSTNSVLETCSRELLSDGAPDATLHLPSKHIWDEKGYQVSCEKGYCGSCHDGKGDHEFVSEHCNAEVWDVGYLTCPKHEVEFEPTCSVIEEVFGVG
ncbi:hypothetical protein U1Q18_046114 [Sarracenia purpurea var. burkii]